MVAKSRGGKKCTCNLGWAIIAWILIALGIWALAGGFITQFNSAVPLAVDMTVLGWYFGGVVLIGLGKLAKWKGCNCGVHGYK